MPAFRAGNVFNNTLGHVHVVVVAGEHGDILLTNWSSVRNPAMCDNSCILQAGDHPLIRHASYMFYAKSRVVTQQWLLERVAEGNLVQVEDLDAQVLQRVVDGARSSPRLFRGIKSQFHLN